MEKSCQVIEILFWIGIGIVFYTYLGYGIVLYLMVKIKELSLIHISEPTRP